MERVEEKKLDFKDTIFLPKTDFPMKANLAQKELEILEFWEKNSIYEKVLKERKEVFTVHDGPPYANGHIHLGHALNKVIKDITVKHALLSGKKAEFVPGWDCHGLPIEKEVEKKIGRDKPPVEIRKESRKYAQHFIEVQKNEFKRLGVFATYTKPYITMSPDYEAMIVRSINEIWKKGRIYSDQKPVFWCPVCITALAEAEVEYKIKKSPSIYVLFPAKFKKIGSSDTEFEKLFALVWTTTPWTIPGNFALAFHPSIKYVIAKKKDEKYIIVAEKLANILGEYEKVDTVVGSEFEGKVFSHPIFGRDSVGVIGDFVSEEEGTGIVHIAPGHGKEDYEVGKKYSLPVQSVLDEFGRGNQNSIKYNGIFYEEMNRKVIEDLKEKGFLFQEGEYEHSYPHCWRCKKPVVFRATRQWFIKVEDIRQDLIEQAKKVKWIPDWGITRMESTLASKPDWCISRQRAWGVPIPYFVCKNCGEYIWSEYAAEKIAEFTLEGEPDAWWEKDIKNFIPEDFRCFKCGSSEFEKGKDVLDVWIDSGLSFKYMKNKENFSFPADVYIEGTDQHRGWFQSSLTLSFLLEGIAPYKKVFTHGFILDEFKRKMSKSLGNVISPEDIIKEDGAEIVRLWAVFSDPTEDVKISERILSDVKDMYRKIRNTIRFMLGVLGDNPDSVPSKIFPQDIYFLSKLRGFEKEVLNYYDQMEYHKAARKIHNFADNVLSALYLDIIKDTIYCDSKDNPRRLSAQYTVFLALKSIIALSAPILSFLAEEAYFHMPEVFGFRKFESVFFETYDRMLLSKSNIIFEDEEKINKFFSEVEKIRKEFLEVIDKMRKAKEVGNSLEIELRISVPPFDFCSEEEMKQILEEFFIVSCVRFSVGEPKLIEVKKYENAKKCPRCWKYFEGENEICKRCESIIRYGNSTTMNI
jgi:isoleucyl-tRNA synthetase